MKYKRLSDNRGLILPLVLMAFVILGALAAAILSIGGSEAQIASNHLRAIQALFVAEAGAERALAQFIATPSLVTNAPATCPAPASPSVILGTGTANVTYDCTAGPSTIRITSVGTAGGAQRVVRVVATTSYLSNYAVLADQVEMNGNAKVRGTLGAVHGNSATELQGSAFVDQTATSYGNTCTNCTSPQFVGVPGSSGPNKPLQTIPLANPMDFIAKADFVFGDGTTVVNGITVPQDKILRTSDNQLFNAGDAPFAGWSMQTAGKWRFSGGTTPPNGTYYASQEIDIQASPGSVESPWRATFVAGTSAWDGEVNITGHPNIVSYLQDLLILASEAGMHGTGGSAGLTGVIVATAGAHGEAEIEGAVNLTGNIITTGEAELGGNATVTLNSKTVIPLTGPLQILSWGL